MSAKEVKSMLNKEDFQKIVEEQFTYIKKLEKQAELAEHYKHLYSKVKKQKDDAVEYVNSIVFEESFTFVRERAEVKYNLLRMLGEIDEL